MNGSSIRKPGSKSSPLAIKRATKEPNTDNLMTEVGGAIDQAIALAGREAALSHIREGLNVPVWENGKTVWKPAAQALAEADARRAADEAGRKTKKPAPKSSKSRSRREKPLAV